MQPTALILPATVARGELRLNRRRMREWLAHRRDGAYVVTIERQHATRSLAQNAYYWGVVLGALCEHTGYTPEEMHNFLKQRFLPKRITLADANGELVEECVVGISTTRLNKLQFGEYLEQVVRWAGEELGVVVPAAHEWEAA